VPFVLCGVGLITRHQKGQKKRESKVKMESNGKHGGEGYDAVEKEISIRKKWEKKKKEGKNADK